MLLGILLSEQLRHGLLAPAGCISMRRHCAGVLLASQKMRKKRDPGIGNSPDRDKISRGGLYSKRMPACASCGRTERKLGALLRPARKSGRKMHRGESASKEVKETQLPRNSHTTTPMKHVSYGRTLCPQHSAGAVGSSARSYHRGSSPHKAPPC